MPVEQILTLAILLASIFAFLCKTLQRLLERQLHRAPRLIWIAPPVFTAIFAAASGLVGAFNASLTVLVLVYTAAPVLVAHIQGPGRISSPSTLDFVTILLLWLPLEFSAGASLIPKPAQGFLHSVAYGIAIILALIIFTGFRSFPNLKINLPQHSQDYWLPFAAFAVTAPILAVAGIALGFIPEPHGTEASFSRMFSTAALIFVGTALPEEILFRSLIQNLLDLRFGSSTRTLFIGAFIFGCAHLNNGPQALPNWRYMILATIAGIAYAAVFRKASTVLSSATLHMLVDWTKRFFF